MEEKLKIDLHEIVNIKEKYRAAFVELMEDLKEVVNSDRFKKEVINYFWNNNGIIQPTYWMSDSKSNKEVYEMFMSGATKLDPNKDGDIDLYLALYYSYKGVIGYTKPSSSLNIWVNTKFFYSRLKTRKGNSQIIANIVHEYCHLLGFKHEFFRCKKREHSVPYAVGRIAGNIAYEMLG